MMKALLLFALVVLAVSSGRLNYKYRDVLVGKEPLRDLQARKIYLEFEGSYPRSEYRFGVFLQTLREIIQHNKGVHTWSQGINQYSDMTFEEFKAIKLMAPQNCSATENRFKMDLSSAGVGIPDRFEWNNFGMVTPVKNQGSCGSCWTFSTVGAMESHWNILGKGKDVIFSEQQLVDCAGAFDNHGCSGGLPSHAFEYIKYTGAGLELSATYPYVAKNGNCTYNNSKGVGYAKYGSYNISAGNEVELADRLYNVGPIAVSFQVITGFKNYISGVYDVQNCGTTTMDINHAVLATGYGIEEGKPFWNIKNSWGTTWGLYGYFKIQRGQNMCAISQCNSYPLIDRPATNSNLRI